MAWGEGLLSEQRAAASYTGSHARLLAGPGTGKTRTLIQRICYLVEERNVPTDQILVISFTRATAGELGKRIAESMSADKPPSASTLHSFSLKELLRNANNSPNLLPPLRIADDYEESEIIEEDIKNMLNLGKSDALKHSKSDINELFRRLSADWESLNVDSKDWETKFPDPKFLAAWREHRSIYGYILRSEIVYQLKNLIERRGDFSLRKNIKYVLVDEYQDLNRCDMAIIKYIAQNGGEVFAVGDDDQSIYGFRMAHPEGIRRFDNDYSGSESFLLTTCFRCPQKILEMGLHVINQDGERIQKNLASVSELEESEARIINFSDQEKEALGIAKLCQSLIASQNVSPFDILILVRTDNKVLIEPIVEALSDHSIPVSVKEKDSKMDLSVRVVLCFLRLIIDNYDILAWRTLLDIWCVNIGRTSITAIYNFAKSSGDNFVTTLEKIFWNPNLLDSRIRARVIKGIEKILFILDQTNEVDLFGVDNTSFCLTDKIKYITNLVFSDDIDIDYVASKYEEIIQKYSIESIEDLLRTVTSDYVDIEEILDIEKINILTMHKAKGLESKVVIIAAAEDEFIPYNVDGSSISEERRLLYVSLTRAKERLYITYCDRRTGSQLYLGRNKGRLNRSLTRYLLDSPYVSESGDKFLREL